MKKYDFIVIGAGPAGIFTAYELNKRNKNWKILILERGRQIEKRKCPERVTGKCVKCKPCNITAGFAGAGAWSDGKLSLDKTGNVGGNLKEYMSHDEFSEIMDYTDNLYLDFGVPTIVYGSKKNEMINKIKRDAIKANLQLIDCPIRHMGTEIGHNVYTKIQNYLLGKGIEILFGEDVIDLIVDKNKISGVKTIKEEKYFSENVIIAVGRSGSEWLKDITKNYNIPSISLPVDIGVRIETNNEVMKVINENLYESKFIYYTPTFDDKVRVFCSNPSGVVAKEHYGDLAVVNGHAYNDEKKKTDNTNFALLVSRHFGDDFDTITHGKKIAELTNQLAGGNDILVQRYGDILRGRRTTPERILRGNIIPTLKEAVAGDLTSGLTYRVMKDIIEMIEALDKVAPGFASDELLLYGTEIKFYSNKIKTDKCFQTNIKGLYTIGDGAGITRGLMQASMNGVYLARNI